MMDPRWIALLLLVRSLIREISSRSMMSHKVVCLIDDNPAQRTAAWGLLDQASKDESSDIKRLVAQIVPTYRNVPKK